MFSAPFSAPRAISGTVISASGSGGVPGTNATRGSRCASLASTGLRWTTAQPVIPCPYGIVLASHLLGPRAAREHGHELALLLVRLVDVQVVVRDELAERVGDAVEQRLGALLGEHVVEDACEAPVRLDERLRARHERSSRAQGRARAQR